MASPSTVSRPRNALALYVHWPFCRRKCPYCDFNSHVRDGVDQPAWRAALLAELRYWHARMDRPYTLGSIFFGGGTPSLMPPDTVAALIDEAMQLWPASPDIEITLEANPTSVEAANFVALRRAGVNRLSLGVQSLRAPSLAFLGREHSVAEALAAVALAAATFPRFSFDLIYALPGQTCAAWEEELTEALTHAGGHVSLYQLTIEPNTAFHHQYHVGKAFTLPAEALAARLYRHTQAIMEAAGLPAYEISNHAAPGQEGRHNLSYWRSASYLGIGPGAHGRVDLGAGRLATQTRKSPERWLAQVHTQGHGIEETLMLSAEERMEEAVLMGLRLPREGFDPATLPPASAALWRDRLAEGRAANLAAQGLLRIEEGRYYPTADGALVLNALATALLA